LFLLVLEGTLIKVPKVKELRDCFKKAGFIKVSKIKQAKKHPEHKAKNSDRLACQEAQYSVGSAKTLI
jgi:hypothetical protein